MIKPKYDMIPLNRILEEYTERVGKNEIKSVAVGRYGIRKREDIYSKALTKDFTKYKVIYNNTLTIGMGSNQIDIGVLSENAQFCVSPAYHTFKIKNVDAEYLDYCLKAKNEEMFKKYSKRGARQGKSIDLKKWLNFKIPVYEIEVQKQISANLKKIDNLIELNREQLSKLEKLVKSQFIEMFGDPIYNPKSFDKKTLSDECDIITGNTPSRKIKDYYGDYIEWIKSDNICENKTFLTKAKESLSEKGLKVGRYVDKECILMTCIAGSLKSIGNVSISDRKVSFNQQINGIIPKNNNVYFLYEQFILSKEYLLTPVNMSLKGILSKSDLSKLKFIFPPKELQNKFGKIFMIIDNQKTKTENLLKDLEELRISMMQEYFN